MRTKVLPVVTSVVLVLLAMVPGACVSIPPGWPQSTGDVVASSPGLGDLEGDGKLEVVVGSWDHKVYAWHADGTPVAGWPQTTGSYVHGSPALADLDGDGKLEVVVGSWDDKVYAWHADGTAVAGWPQTTGGYVGSPALGDLDGDGKLELVASSGDGKVYAWHADGTPVAGWPLALGVAADKDPALGDLDGDGKLEVVLVVGSLGVVYVWHADGTPVAGWPQYTAGWLTSSPALGDLEGDGTLEVVVGSWSGKVYAWHADGSPVAGWPQTTGGNVYSSPALGDLDGDGKLEVVVGSDDYKVYAWHADGTSVAGWPQTTGSWVLGSPALGDLDGDGKLEVVVGSYDYNVYAWHADGTAVAGWPQATGSSVDSSPALGDLEGDGKLEAVVGSNDGKVYAWKCDTTTNDRLPWPMFHHDARHTGLYLAARAPVADFAASPTSGVAPLTVQFTDTSTGHPTSWFWAFGDGGTSTQQSPSHTYTAAGSYTVSLTVSNAGGSATDTEPNCVSVDPPAPACDFSATPTSGLAPLLVSFAYLAPATPTWAAATGWQWSFGDGGTSALQDPSHAYATPGSYTVSLTASNAGGSTTATKPHYVLVSFPDVPVQPAFWALNQILACVDAQIVAGYPDGGYHPSEPVTRDQMAVYISRALAGGDVGVPTPPATASFPDVPTTHWAYRYIEYAKAQSIVQGYADGYHPADKVTRDQMAVYIARAVTTPTDRPDVASYTPPTTPSFADVPTTQWAYRFIEYCKSKSIVQGYADGYHPADVVTRDQMAVYVQRAFHLPL